MSDISHLGGPPITGLYPRPDLDTLGGPDGGKEVRGPEPKGLGDLPNVVFSHGHGGKLGIPDGGHIELAPPKTPHDGSVDGAALKLGMFNCSAVSVLEIAKVIQESNLEARETARQDRQAARDADVSAQLDAAQKTRDMANFNFAATVVTSSLAIVGAAVSTVGTVKAINMRSDAGAAADKLTAKAEGLRLDALDSAADANSARATAGQMNPASRPSVAQAQQELLNKAAQSDNVAGRQNLAAQRLENTAARITRVADNAAKKIDTYSAFAGTAITEGGKIVGASLQRVAAEKDAEKSELQAKSTVARSKAEDETDFIHAYSDNIRAVLDKLSAIQQAEADTNRSIIRG